MARPLRVEYENACYHIINRGNHRDVVFKNSSDCEIFIEKLVEFTELYDVVIYSYCLMPNHFHLQIRTRHPNLSKFMQSFLTSFTINMNRKYQSSGHLFQGRYKAQLVESVLYKNELSRYIHLNPVKIKGHEELSVRTLKSRLKEYKWSSYRGYIGLEKKPSWLDRRFVLSSWGKAATEKMHNYQKYVEQGIKTNNADDIPSTLSGSIIGSESFRDKIVSKYLNHDVTDIDSREQPVLATINTCSVDDILDAVMDYYKLDDIEKVTVRRGCHPEARKMAMFLAGKHCRRKTSLTSLAERFGVKISGLNMSGDKFKSSLKKNRSLQIIVGNIEKIMNDNNKMEV